ncbi:hypothetical protein [Demequina iriomotensis]|uniref:hypothetical protein n=1 Tax=Demequina iriomotensis TaxID=1536641 RepID=UPI000786024A|nr:hypothetical protein [Demequina iriomotensis]
MSAIHVDIELAKLRKAVDAFEDAAGYGDGRPGWLHGCGRRLLRLAWESQVALSSLERYTLANGLGRPEPLDAVWARWWLATAIGRFFTRDRREVPLLADAARDGLAARGDWRRAAIAAQIAIAATDVIAGEIGSGLAPGPLERELDVNVTGLWLGIVKEFGDGELTRDQVEHELDRWRAIHSSRSRGRPREEAATAASGGFGKPDGGCECEQDDEWCHAPVLASTPLSFALMEIDEGSAGLDDLGA